ncbi:PAS domain S-box protein [Halorientalis brevis]|uniref:histidine kinase n=1 Tax=Halorientalis brevis TaxID=1126241 RepID=A0ABD6C7G2_9EURY|nr:PAS domain S-box protein [Halorientalis brevis]
MVLHVDDDEELRKLVSAWMGAHTEDIEIIAKRDADAALATLRSTSVDCIVSDYEMPGADGLTFLERVRESHPNLPFILFTGKGSEEIASEAISAGVTDYLQKQSGTEQYEVLVNRIRNAVERRRTQAALEESEQKYSTLVEEANDGVLIVQNGTFTFANETAATILGTTVDEVQGASMPSFVVPEDREILADRYVRREDGGDVPNRYEFTALRPDGERVPIELTSSRITYDGEPAVMAICRDVSERTSRERELEQYRTLVETVGDPMYVLDTEGRITMVNEGFTDHAGVPRSQLEGAHVSEYMSEEAVRKGTTLIQELLESDGRDRGRFEFETDLREDRRIFEDNVAILTDEDDEYVGSVGILRDVTERKERERDLAMYQTIVETIPDVALAIDAGGTIIEINETGAEMIGRPKSELLGTSIPELVTDGVVAESALEKHVDALRDLLSADSDADEAVFEFVAYQDDGEERIFENRLALLPYEDAYRGTTGIVRDITERKERERQLQRQNERLDAFADVLSHDLRNPLGVAMGRAELLRRELADRSAPGEGTLTTHLDHVDRAHDRIDDIIDDVLTLARQGETVADSDRVALTTVAEDAWLHVETREATLRVPDAGAIRADPNRLTRLLENLFRNAVEHGDSNVTVTVGVTDDGFYVADDGPGIPPAERDRIFESGYSRSPDGTGYGLAIVAEIAGAHGWDVTATESASGGARFEFSSVETR